MTDIQAILSGLRSAPAILGGFIREIPPHTLTRRRGEGV